MPQHHLGYSLPLSADGPAVSKLNSVGSKAILDRLVTTKKIKIKRVTLARWSILF